MGAFKGKISKVLTSFSQGANILTTFPIHTEMSCLPCLSCLPELDNSGDTGGHREMSVSLSHLRRDPFRETAAFLGASQLECDACQVCAQFPGRCWAKFRARGKKDAWSYLPFTTLYNNSDKKKENPGFSFRLLYLYMMPENIEGTDLGNADDAVSHLWLCEAKALSWNMKTK